MVILLLLTSLAAFAVEGIIGVLEAPLFQKADSDSYVIQYLKKSDKLYIHPTYQNDKFFKTLTSIGEEAYVLKHHVLSANATLEESPLYDDTDYRLPEPLWETYPFKEVGGYRGQVFLELGGEARRPDISATQVNLLRTHYYGFNFLWAKRLEQDITQRNFWGWLFTFKYSNITLKIDGKEQLLKNNHLAFGPYRSMDVWKQDHHMLTLFAGAQLSLYDGLAVSNEEETSYKRWGALIPTGFFYTRRKLLGDLDFTLGLKLNLVLGTNYLENNSAPPFPKELPEGIYSGLGLSLGFQNDF